MILKSETNTDSLVVPAKWWALHTRSRFEQKVHKGLCGKSLEAFLPRIQVMSRRKDRRKKILVPFDSGICFCPFGRLHRRNIIVSFKQSVLFGWSLSKENRSPPMNRKYLP